MKVRSDIIFWVDKGCNRIILEEDMVKAGNSKEDFDQALSEMIDDGTLTMGRKSGYIVVTAWSPNSAEKLRNE
jgi:hypothetical protein